MFLNLLVPGWFFLHYGNISPLCCQHMEKFPCLLPLSIEAWCPSESTTCLLSADALSVRQLLPGGQISAGTPCRWPVSLLTPPPAPASLLTPVCGRASQLHLTLLHPRGRIHLHCSRNYIHVDKYTFIFSSSGHSSDGSILFVSYALKH